MFSKNPESIKFELTNSDSCFVFFAGIKGSMQIPIFEFYNVARVMNCSKIFIRDIHQHWYLSGLKGVTTDVFSTIEFLKPIISKAKRTVFVGNSMGGFGALMFGALMNVETVVFCPQTFICPILREKYGDHRWSKAIHDMYKHRRTKQNYWDLEPLFKQALNATIFVGNNKLDEIHAKRLENKVKIKKFDTSGHNIVKYLRDNHQLENALRDKC